MVNTMKITSYNMNICKAHTLIASRKFIKISASHNAAFHGIAFGYKIMHYSNKQ